MKNLSKILESVWSSLVEHLKGKLFKLALKKILGSAYAVGFKAWLIKFLLSHLWDELIDPLLNAALVEIKYIKDKIDGKITVEKIERARKEGDGSLYDDTIDTTFG